MIKITEKSKCSGCSACAMACPLGCISMVRDNEGFLYPKVDDEKCVHCGLCSKICPILNKNDIAVSDISAYAVINKNEEIRKNSSSGGVFSLFAGEVIRNNGVVFGASFSDDFKSVHHIVVTKIEELAKLRGSKYLQSNIDCTYQDVEFYLKKGTLVYFSGTPCQIGGLYAYLRKDYDNLITQDLICHGVPSPLVWQKYVEHRSAHAKSSVNKVSFRSKNSGWKKFSVSISFKNDTEYLCEFPSDPFMRLFLDNYCLRPSCYDCSFKGKIRQSDITLADFWGINKVLPDMDDDKGTSLVFINSEKGRKLFDTLKNNLNFNTVGIESAVKYNIAMTNSVSPPKKQNRFWIDFNKKSFNKLEKKYCKPVKASKLRIILSKIKRKILGVKK